MYVVKIGGSLFPEYVDDIIDILKKSKEDVLLVNGGGELANKLRGYDLKYHYSSDTSHWMAIRCMDIIGCLIADKHEDVVTITSLDCADEVIKMDRIPLLLTYDLLKKKDPLAHDWSVTSDSIACWVASQLNAKLLILTNVDGIYNGDIWKKNKKLIEKISANELLIFEETSVDKCLPKLLIKYHLDCFVVNGKYPERVLALLNSDNFIKNIYTYIGG